MPPNCITGCMGQNERVTALTVIGGGVTRIYRRWVRGHRNYFTSVDAGQNLTVTAVTRPANAAANVQWSNGAQGANVQIPRTPAGGPVTITASLDNSKSVNLYFVEIQSLVCENGQQVGHTNTWKFYVGNGYAEITATPNPNEDWFRNQLEWDWHNVGVAGRSNRRRRVRLNAAGDVVVSPNLYQATATVTVHVCQVPELEVDQLTFANGHTVNCDTRGNFDNIWERNRNAPAAPVNVALNTLNGPLCYTRNSPIRITAQFRVTQQPTEQEDVTVRGTANFKGTQLRWEQNNVTVNPGDPTVTINNMDSDQNIPDRVDYYENLTITWQVIGPDGVTKAAGQTTHQIYATLGDPNGTPAYWTLLEISCRAARNATTPNALVNQAYAEFGKHRGDGNGFHRQWDNRELTYYLDGVNTRGGDDPWGNPVDVYFTRDLLGNADGTGRCGGWADFFSDMCKTHGITTAQVIGVVTRVNGLRFLVQNCDFKGAGTQQAPFTHEAGRGNNRCTKRNGAAGQGKTNPEFDFGDHGMVQYAGQIYDPSYGTGPYPTLRAWENASIAGLGDLAGGLNTDIVQFCQNGTPQFMMKRCSRGYIEHQMQAGETLADVATQYGVATANALFNHPYNHAIRASRNAIGDIQQNDVILIPRNISNIEMLKIV